MTDTVDVASEVEQRQLDRAIAATKVPMPQGVAGTCRECGRKMPRLVGGRCGFCRDGRTR